MPEIDQTPGHEWPGVFHVLSRHGWFTAYEDISVTAKYYVDIGLDQKQEAVDSLVRLPA